MASDLPARPDANNNRRYRNVQYPAPQRFHAPSHEVEHPAPILNTNVNPVSEIFSYSGDENKFVLVMVGLPARGKSFIARKLRSYLSWLGFDVQWFNIGQYRRYLAEDTVGTKSSDFFDPNNEVTKKRRELYALIALAELEKFLLNDQASRNKVAILDGTNSTDYRRRMIRRFFQRKDRPLDTVKLLFIESICNDEAIIEQNIRNVKLRSPDYRNVAPEKAMLDFKQRIKHYERTYSPVTDDDGSYIKVIDAGKKVIGHQVDGYLASRILFYLMHLNLTKVSHFFTRHGESLYNTQRRIGGDSPLTESGKKYSQTMADFISCQPEFDSGEINVWCSTLKRSVQTAEAFQSCSKVKINQWRALGDIDVGMCDSMTYTQIAARFPQEHQQRLAQKLSYRYPQGESYKDVIKRLEPVIFELERATKPVVVIAHRAVLRCLYGYFMDRPLEEIPYISINLHTVYRLSPTDYSTEVGKFTFGCGHSLFSDTLSRPLPMLPLAGSAKESAASLSQRTLLQQEAQAVYARDRERRRYVSQTRRRNSAPVIPRHSGYLQAGKKQPAMAKTSARDHAHVQHAGHDDEKYVHEKEQKCEIEQRAKCAHCTQRNGHVNQLKLANSVSAGYTVVISCVDNHLN